MYENEPTEVQRPPYSATSPEEAQRLIEVGAVVVDVRQPNEWQTGHIADARLIPLDGIYAFGRAAATLPRDADLIFVCEMGQRSAVASEIALVAGFAPEHVHNLTGGMSAWRRQRLPVER
jgi:rhodanese-related sulfurtransferase